MSNPISAISRSLFAWPLIRRELFSLLRTGRAFWLLVASVVVSCAVPLLQWPSGDGGLVFFQENLVVFAFFLFTQLSIALLVIPAFTAGAIAGERERETYDLLYSTLLRPSAMIVSKIIAATGYVVLLLLASAPGASLLYMLGGFDFETVLKAYAVIFSSVICAGVICLSVSMRSNRTTPAAVRSYVWVAFWTFGVYLFGLLGIFAWSMLDSSTNGLFRAMEDPDFLRVWELISCTSPFTVLSSTIFAETIGALPMSQMPAEPWLLHVGYCAVLSVLHFAYLLRRVRMPSWSNDRAKTAKAVDPETKMRVRQRKTAWFARWLLHRTRNAGRSGGLAAFSNPIFRRELLCEFAGNRRFRRVLFWVPAISYTLAGFAMDWEYESLVVAMMGTLVFLTLVVPAVAATSISREREQNNMDLLRGTSVSMQSIFNAKVFSSFLAGIGPICAAMIFAVALLYLDRFGGPEVRIRGGRGIDSVMRNWAPIFLLAKMLIVLLVTNLFLVTLGTFFSVVSKSSVSALVKTFAGLGLGFMFLPMILGMGGAGEIIIGISPFGTMGTVIFSPDFSLSQSKELSHTIYLFSIVYGFAILFSWAVGGSLFDDQDRD